MLEICEIEPRGLFLKLEAWSLKLEEWRRDSVLVRIYACPGTAPEFCSASLPPAHWNLSILAMMYTISDPSLNIDCIGTSINCLIITLGWFFVLDFPVRFLSVHLLSTLAYQITNDILMIVQRSTFIERGCRLCTPYFMKWMSSHSRVNLFNSYIAEFQNPDLLNHEAVNKALILKSKLRLDITALESEQTNFEEKRKLEHAVSSSSSNSGLDCGGTSVLVHIYYCRRLLPVISYVQ